MCLGFSLCHVYALDRVNMHNRADLYIFAAVTWVLELKSVLELVLLFDYFLFLADALVLTCIPYRITASQALFKRGWFTLWLLNNLMLTRFIRAFKLLLDELATWYGLTVGALTDRSHQGLVYLLLILDHSLSFEFFAFSFFLLLNLFFCFDNLALFYLFGRLWSWYSLSLCTLWRRLLAR